VGGERAGEWGRELTLILLAPGVSPLCLELFETCFWRMSDPGLSHFLWIQSLLLCVFGGIATVSFHQ